MVAAPRLTPLAAAAVAAWMLAAAAVEAGDPPLSPKGVNYEGARALAVARGWGFLSLGFRVW
jgi:hypothetical protein